MRLAYFITAHGFGHAARAAAVMAALHGRNPSIHFEIFTQVPRWFFETSLSGPFTHHDALTDIGLVQPSPLQEDLPQTLQRLNAFLPFDESRLGELAARVRGCALVLCDIAPLGIAVAHASAIPSVLIENFTWDWIYEGYVAEAPGLQPHIDYLRKVYASTDYHVQTAPACDNLPPAHLITRPVSRVPRTPAAQIRERLGLPPNGNVIFLTMGGIPSQFEFLERLNDHPQVHFVIPIPSASEAPRRKGNVVFLPHRSEFYHPDLLNASNVVVGKVGYSTLAEAYHAGVPCGYVRRARFREAPVLVDFMRAHLQGGEISAARFEEGSWLADLTEILGWRRVERGEPNGAAQIAEFVSALINA